MKKGCHRNQVKLCFMLFYMIDDDIFHKLINKKSDIIRFINKKERKVAVLLFHYDDKLIPEFHFQSTSITISHYLVSIVVDYIFWINHWPLTFKAYHKNCIGSCLEVFKPIKTSNLFQKGTYMVMDIKLYKYS